MPELLKTTQIHQGYEMSDVQTIGSGVKSDVNGTRLFHEPIGYRLWTGRLMNQSPPCKFLNDVLHNAEIIAFLRE